MIKDGDWYRTWFDSPYYRDVYSHKDKNEASDFADLIQKEISPDKNWNILDFCCGAGRLSIELAKRGYKVDGFDLSEKLLSMVKEASQKLRLNLHLEVCDMRNFNRFNCYDLTISFFTSFGYFNDVENKKVFLNMCNSIKQGGWLVLDFFNSDFVRETLVDKDERFENDYRVIQKRWIENNRINKEITIKNNGNSNVFIESVQIYSKEELTNMFESAELKVQKVCGDYKGSDFSSDGQRTIIFAQK
jgi:SAM-dependent methyltransferase